MDSTLDVSVEFYSGSTYAERPRVICWGEERFMVARVIKRWRSPDESGFLVCTVDEKLIELHSIGATGRWWARMIPAEENAFLI
jgi:hypothetical protein